MRVYYDLEFIEDGKTTDPISIGMFAEDGREYYAVNADMPVDRIHDNEWLMRNVWPNLPVVGFDWSKVSFNVFPQKRSAWGELDTTSPLVKPKWVIANEVREFLREALPAGEDESLELWSWYAAYDHVALMQLWGSMMKRPEHVPMYTHDLKQEQHRLGVADEDLPAHPGRAHDALSDAVYHHMIHQFLMGLAGS